MFQSGNDDLVMNCRQNEFFTHNKNFEKIHFKKAKHEIFQEADPVRDEVLKKSKEFLSEI